MNISDRLHKENQKLREQLTKEGFEFEVTPDCYRVAYKGKFLNGGAIMKRDKPLHWRHRVANLRDNLNWVIQVALRYKKEQQNESDF